MADYSPYVPGTSIPMPAARSIWDQGIAPLAGKAQDYFKGLAEIFPTVGEYVSESILRSGPKGTPTTSDLLLGIGKMGLEARSVAGEMGEYAKENPIEMALSMAPVTGPAIGVMDAENLMAQARAAEEAGDWEKASNLRQLATFSLLGSLPFVPKVVRKGGDEALDSLDRANRNRAQRIEETGEGFVPSEDPVLPEGRRGDPYDPELDVLERQKRIEEANLSSEDLLKRGASQNWNIDTPLYHYTRSPEFSEFKLPDPDTGRSAYGSSAKGIESTYGPGVYTSTSPTRYGGKSANTNVSGWRAQHSSIPEDMRSMTLFSRGKIARPLEVQAAEAQIKAQIENGTRRGMLEVDPNMPGNWRHQYWSDIHQVLKDQGFTGLQMNEIVLIFDPKNLRNVKARFDPGQAGSANLLSGIASIGAMEGIA